MAKTNGTFEEWAKKGYAMVDGEMKKIVTYKKVEKISSFNIIDTHTYEKIADRPAFDNVIIQERINELENSSKYFLLPTTEALFIKYKFDINPCPAPRMTQSDKWLMPRRKPVEQYFKFRDALQGLCLESGYKLTGVLNILFVIPFPKSYSTKKRFQLLGQSHQQRPDRDNYLKSFQDSFSGDDGYVWDGRTIKVWGHKGQIIIF